MCLVPKTVKEVRDQPSRIKHITYITLSLQSRRANHLESGQGIPGIQPRVDCSRGPARHPDVNFTMWGGGIGRPHEGIWEHIGSHGTKLMFGSCLVVRIDQIGSRTLTS